MNNEPEIKLCTAKRKADLAKEIIKGKTTTKETARAHDLTPSSIERWVDDAMKSMEDTLKANPMDASELYEKKIP